MTTRLPASAGAVAVVAALLLAAACGGSSGGTPGADTDTDLPGDTDPIDGGDDDPADGDTDGDATDGDATDGDTVDGDATDGDTADADTTDGDAADNDPAENDEVASPCVPNPCTEAHQGVCRSDGAGGFECDCDPGYHFDALGAACTADPCDPNPCTEATRRTCIAEGASHRCECSRGLHPTADGSGCTADPCDPNPCAEAGRSACVNTGGIALCDCDDGLHPGASGTCTADPCDPDPCGVEPGRTVCVDQGGVASCACDERFYDTQPDGSCAERASNVRPDQVGTVDWRASPPTFQATIRVLEAGTRRPISGATAQVGTVRLTTNADGLAMFPGLEAGGAPVVRVSAPGRASAVIPLGLEAGLSGRPLVVELDPLITLALVDPVTGATGALPNVEVRAPGRSFVGTDDRPFTGRVEIVASPERGRPDGPGRPTSGIVVGPDGQRSPLQSAVGEVFIGWRAPDLPAGATPPVLADDASLTFTVPITEIEPGVELPEGLRVPFYCLDETEGVWRIEGSCAVTRLAPAQADGPERVGCTGALTRPCRIAAGIPPETMVGRRRRDWQPQSAADGQCILVHTTPTLPSRFEVVAEEYRITWDSFRRLPHDGCNPSRTRGSLIVEFGEAMNVSDALVVPDSDGIAGGLAVTTNGPETEQGLYLRTVQIRYTLRDRTDGGTGLLTVDGLATVREHPTDRGSVDYAACRNEALYSTVQCQALRYRRQACERFPGPTLTEDVILAALYPDEDGDNYPLFTGAGTPPASQQWDCDDADGGIHPGAEDNTIDGVDQDCDGIDGRRLHVSDYDNGRFGYNPTEWNALCATWCGSPSRPRPWTCPASAPLMLQPDRPGAPFDMNCDGYITDRDADGYSATGEPVAGVRGTGDCDDTTAAVSPGVPELPGNPYDENCDGRFWDFDNDGFYHPDHYPIEGVDASQFTDCNDRSALAYPGGPGSESFLAAYYVKRSEGSPVVRRAAFCELFDGSGAPNRAFQALSLDRNCDGFVSDRDGDGWTVPGDHSLGRAYAWDCDDLDPRVHPVAPSAFDWLPPACVRHGPGENESECQVDTTGFGADFGPACPNMPDGSRTYCKELVDQNGDGWGVNVCNARQWQAGDNPLRPLAVNPGNRMWGPCDFGGILPSCGADLQCGARPGGQPFSDAYTAVLRDLGYDVPGNVYVGMCFPKCGGLCGPVNPCDEEPDRNTCRVDGTVIPRRVQCVCNSGYTDVGGACRRTCSDASRCDDGNVCTTDSCVGGACVHTANEAPCDDGFFCTGPDSCRDGLCSVHDGNLCIRGFPCGELCDESSDTCLPPDDATADDGNVCTADSCGPGALEVIHRAVADGTECAGGVCRAGTCACRAGFLGTPPDCYPEGACRPNPCLNLGACLVENEREVCACPPSATGPRCEHCASGYVADGERGCRACEAGTSRSASGGMGECEPCRPGTFSGEGAAACRLCPRNTFASDWGSAACEACAPGSFSASGARACTRCEAGTMRAAGQADCTQCAPGTYSEEGAAACTPCEAGFFSGIAGASQCEPCPAGQFSSGLGAGTCQYCPAGTFAPAGATRCLLCEENTVAPDGGAASCVACPPRTFANEDHTACGRRSVPPPR